MTQASNEEIEAADVGRLTVHDDTIYLADYEETWAELFASHAERIRGALGAVALGVEHVGSTAVPGLAAKPIIDIVVTVPDSSDESAFVAALEAAGYVLRIREPESFEHRMFNRPESDVHVHVLSAGCVEVDHMVNFRDHLRADSNDRALYERTKQELAARRWKYVQHYADAKSDVIAEIMTRAESPHERAIAGPETDVRDAV